MPADRAWNEIARLLVGAFDVDIQHWMGRAFVRLRETPGGASFADWAETNPVVFETLLRVTSAAVRSLPKDDNLLIETVYTQLARLPVEVERAVKDGTPRFVSRGTRNDDEFFRRYEDAVKDLSDDDLTKVVRLEYQRLHKWVNSPRRVRPHLLKKWAEQDSEGCDKSEHSRAAMKEGLTNVADWLAKWAAGRKSKYERVK